MGSKYHHLAGVFLHAIVRFFLDEEAAQPRRIHILGDIGWARATEMTPSSKHERFLDYGEADNFHRKLEEIRTGLAKEAGQADKRQSGRSQNESDPAR